MIKKLINNDNENTDRWVVSYADFITLLFAFFTAMYAISNLDSIKFDKFSISIRKAIKIYDQPDFYDKDEEKVQIDYIENEFKKLSTTDFNKNDIFLYKLPNKVIISILDSALFEPSDYKLKEDGKNKLFYLSGLLKKVPNEIKIEGHTDSIPSKGNLNNMELSVIRAAAVSAFLIEKLGIPPEKVTVSGYGGYKPVVSNETQEGRVRNRRIDIIIYAEKTNEN